MLDSHLKTIYLKEYLTLWFYHFLVANDMTSSRISVGMKISFFDVHKLTANNHVCSGTTTTREASLLIIDCSCLMPFGCVHYYRVDDIILVGCSCTYCWHFFSVSAWLGGCRPPALSIILSYRPACFRAPAREQMFGNKWKASDYY